MPAFSQSDMCCCTANVRFRRKVDIANLRSATHQISNQIAQPIKVTAVKVAAIPT